ncbi:MAG TPA: tetratricopeptide repeat protein [Thermodesulfobacteriota bacterium]|nr:tetratricopeptide repeat protein [Thermodesulfobacteriota bacterium]
MNWTGIPKSRVAGALVLVLTTFALYSNTLLNGFVYDDVHQILKNPWITDPGYLPVIFTSSLGEFLPGVASGTYRPMIHVVYMAEYALFGLEPWGYHLVNVILQSGVVVLVFLVASRLIEKDSGIYPFAAALYFALHPAHTEVVAWVSAMQDLAFTILVLCAFYVYAGMERPGAKGTLFAGLLFFIALFFKETALVFLPLVFIHDLALRDSSAPVKNWRAYLAFIALAALYFAARAYAVRAALPGKRWFDLTDYQYLINVFPLVPLYFQKLLFPVNLSAYYYIEPIGSLAEARGFLSLAFIVILGYGIYRAFRYDRLVFFALAWVLVAILPTLYLPGIGKSFFAERYLFFPSVGFCIFAVLLVGRFLEGREFAGAGGGGRIITVTLVVVAAVLLTFQTVKRNSVWRDGFSLWSDTVRKSPGAALPHYNLGVEYARMGLGDLAIEEFKRSTVLDPTYDNAFYNLAVMYDRRGEFDLAVKYYGETLRLNPQSADAHLNLGVIYRKQGQIAEAEAEFQMALRIDSSLEAAGVYLDEIKAMERRK